MRLRGAPLRDRKWDAMASAPLTVLQVNREARDELLPSYSSPSSARVICPGQPSAVLVNYEIDTLYFRVGIGCRINYDGVFKYLFEGAKTER